MCMTTKVGYPAVSGTALLASHRRFLSTAIGVACLDAGKARQITGARVGWFPFSVQAGLP